MANVENPTKKSWNEYSAQEKMEFFMNTEENCTFLVRMDGEEEPRQMKSYKFVLSSISPVFDRMFNGDFKEAKTSDPIRIKDIFTNDFEIFLKYVYGFEVYIENFKNLYDIAQKYMADQLIKSIIRQLQYTVPRKPQESLQLFEIMFYEKQKFTVKCSNGALSEEAKYLKKAIETQCKYLCNLRFDVFMELIGDIGVHTNQAQLFQAIELFYSLNAESSKFQLPNLLKKINFGNINAKDFLLYVDGSNLLDLNIKYKILTDIIKKGLNLNG